MKICVYSDGSATTGDKPGGWGSVIVIDDVCHKELSGYLENSTNNDAELLAAIHGLEWVYRNLHAHPDRSVKLEVTLISDSQIILNWANGSFRFKQEQKLHLYEKIRSLVQAMNVRTQWVKGHSGDRWNERCDKLANNARLLRPIEPEAQPKKETRIGSKKTGTTSLWYCGQLKVIDFETGVIENYDRDLHGKRGSIIEIREEKNR